MESKQIGSRAVTQFESPRPGRLIASASASASARTSARFAYIAQATLTIALCVALGGCGLAAAPCRVASAGLKIIPVVGHAAATPTDACADVIDP